MPWNHGATCAILVWLLQEVGMKNAARNLQYYGLGFNPSRLHSRYFFSNLTDCRNRRADYMGRRNCCRQFSEEAAEKKFKLTLPSRGSLSFRTEHKAR